MNITSWVCGSCACVGIENLGTCRNAEDAMAHFCRLLIMPKKNPYSKEEPKYPKAIESHFVFIAGPEVPGAGHSKQWVRYGSEFAAYIRKNRLGKVSTVSKVLNDKYHPKTTCQVWIWQPSYKALIAWWEAKRASGTIDEKGRLAQNIAADTKCGYCCKEWSKHKDWKCPTGYGGEWE